MRSCQIFEAVGFYLESLGAALVYNLQNICFHINKFMKVFPFLSYIRERKESNIVAFSFNLPLPSTVDSDTIILCSV